VLLLFYSLVPPGSDSNPNWAAIGYPGPPESRRGLSGTAAVRSRASKPSPHLTADVCIVGSGAGGSVVAAELSAAGCDVVVIEEGGLYDERDFNGLELWSYDHLYRPSRQTDDRAVALIAGSVVGGGTVVNWSTCLPPPDWVRSEREQFGLTGVSGPEFDAHLAAVSARISVTEAASDLNEPHRRLQAGCKTLGYRVRSLPRNVDTRRYDPAAAGFIAFGDMSGSKRSCAKTYLQDALGHGARLVPRCRAERTETRLNRAVAVHATHRTERGERSAVTIEAPVIVVAGGALDTPALLLRSGLGNDQVGRHLHLHPASAVLADFDETTDPWWGPPQSLAVAEFENADDGYGFLIEGVHVAPGLLATAIPWSSGLEHKKLMAMTPHAAFFSSIVRDRGSGSVTLTSGGQPLVRYELSDRHDRALLRRGLEELARIQFAAGASRLMTLHKSPLSFDRDRESIDDYLARVGACRLAPGDPPLFSAHHMGSCRMGPDGSVAAADEWGRVRGVTGVWIADASGFPSATGTNPMLTTMALARRTAAAIGHDLGVR
jgi:choline dehydrogenase-like flavoprotein